MLAKYLFCALTIPVVATAAPAHAQSALDRVQAPERLPDLREQSQEHAPIDIEAAPVPAESAAGVFVGAIAFTGLDALDPADFSSVVGSVLGRSLDDDGLRALTAALVQEAQQRGYTFASAQIRPQRIENGVILVDFDEGTIDEIRISGHDSPALRHALEPLVSSGPISLQDVERRLLIAGDIDGLHIRNSRYVREDNRGVLLVETAHDPAAVRITISNEGTRPLGPLQARIELDINGLLTSDDSLSASYTVTPANLSELHFGWARYAKRISAAGTEIMVTGSASRARPGAYLSEFELSSRSWYGAVGVLQPLVRRQAVSVWLETELGVRDLKQSQVATRLRDDRTAVARATLYGYADVGGGRARASVTASRGLGILGATRAGDPLASRFDADGTFTSLNAWGEWTRYLGAAFSVRLAAQGQFAFQPLLVTEEASLGGTGFLRGYDWSERSGDTGLMGSAEVRYDWRSPASGIRNLQLYGFFDGGTVGNIDSDFGSGSLSSTGAGLRGDFTDRLAGSVELAVPLSGPRYDTANEASKVNFRLVTMF